MASRQTFRFVVLLSVEHSVLSNPSALSQTEPTDVYYLSFCVIIVVVVVDGGGSSSSNLLSWYVLLKPQKKLGGLCWLSTWKIISICFSQKNKTKSSQFVFLLNKIYFIIFSFRSILFCNFFSPWILHNIFKIYFIFGCIPFCYSLSIIIEIKLLQFASFFFF